jgi:hypothetical protein
LICILTISFKKPKKIRKESLAKWSYKIVSAIMKLFIA